MGTYVRKQSGSQWYFVLKAGNGETILTSERYVSKQGCDNGIQSCRDNSPHDSRYARLTSSSKQPYFVLKAANGERIGTSEMYSSSQAMENGIQSCKQNGPGSPGIDG